MTRKKRFVDHSFLAALLATFLLFFGIPFLAAIFSFLPATFFHFDEIMATETAAVVLSFLALLVHRLCLRKEHYKGCFSFSKTPKNDVHRAILFVALVDILLFLFHTIFIEGGFGKLVLPNMGSFLVALTAGIYEEVSFRAIPASILMKNRPGYPRIIITVILTSFLFGLAHMGNTSLGSNMGIAVLQTLSAICFGVFMVTIYLRTGSILYPMLFHLLHDIMNMMIPAQSSGVMLQETLSMTEIVPNTILNIAEIIAAIYLLRKGKDIKNTWSRIWAEEIEE